MLLAERPNEFRAVETNLTGRPSASWGTSITPGNNSFPAYAEILGNTTIDTYLIEIWVHSVAASALAKDCLVTIGIDHSGATTYTDVEIVNLLCSGAGTPANGGVFYRFPLFIPAGSALAAKASVGNATVGTLRVGVRLYGKPTRPELVRAGAYVDTFGANTAASNGTTVTSGTTSEGTWTSLAANLTSGRNWWHWQLGMGCSDASITQNNLYSADLGIGTSNTVVDAIIVDDLFIVPQTTEMIAKLTRPDAMYVHDVTGDGALDLWGRLQCSATADTGLSMIGYGLGGQGMAIAEAYTNSQTVTTTEWSLPNDASGLGTPIVADGVYQVFIDVSAMAANDEFRIRIYEKVASGATQRIVEDVTLVGVQGKPFWVSPSLILLHGWDVTLLKIAGTDRSFQWSIRAVT